jgi:hypothetical protein
MAMCVCGEMGVMDGVSVAIGANGRRRVLMSVTVVVMLLRQRRSCRHQPFLISLSPVFCASNPVPVPHFNSSKKMPIKHRKIALMGYRSVGMS